MKKLLALLTISTCILFTSCSTNTVKFNTWDDSVPLSLFSGYCPDYAKVCKRKLGHGKCTIMQYKSALNPAEARVCLSRENTDERNFVRIRPLGGKTQAYKNRLDKPLKLGDKVRVLIYANNSSVESDSSQHTGKNFSVTPDWGVSGKIQGRLFASNASPTTVTSTCSYILANSNLELRPVIGSEKYRYEKRGNVLLNPVFEKAEVTSRTYRLPEISDNGDFRTSWGHFKIFFIDFEVVTK